MQRLSVRLRQCESMKYPDLCLCRSNVNTVYMAQPALILFNQTMLFHLFTLNQHDKKQTY